MPVPVTHYPVDYLPRVRLEAPLRLLGDGAKAPNVLLLDTRVAFLLKSLLQRCKYVIDLDILDVLACERLDAFGPLGQRP